MCTVAALRRYLTCNFNVINKSQIFTRLILLEVLDLNSSIMPDSPGVKYSSKLLVIKLLIPSNIVKKMITDY